MRRFVLWFAGILTLLIAALLLACRLSPWPGVAIITFAFSRGERASEAALEKHVPAGIISRRDIPYGGAPDELLDLYYQDGASAQPTIVWVHGGGFVAGSKNGVANYMKVLAGHGYATIAVEYPRGYGTRYPKPVEAVNAALGFVMRHAPDLKVDRTMLVLAGDSAGAHIASQVAMITTDPAYARALGIAPQLKPGQLVAMLLLSGAYDPSAVNFEGHYGWFLKSVLWAYAGVKEVREDQGFNLMSVTGHVGAAFPPSFISSGNADPLAPQAIALAHRLGALGVPVETLFFPADHVPPLRHEYQFDLDQAAGRDALNRMLAFLGVVREKTLGGRPAD